MPIIYTPPTNGTASGRTDTSGRPGWPPTVKKLMALAPAVGLAQTIAESPTFWFYIPYALDDLAQVELFLYDEANNTVVNTPVQVENIPGIVGIKLQHTKPPLKIDKIYSVGIRLIPNSGVRENLKSVRFLVRRITLSDELKTQLDAANLLERYRLYAENSLWQEALTELIQLRRAVNEDWFSLLQNPNIQLADIASE